MTNWDISTGGKLAILIALIAGSISAGYLARRLGLSARIARALMWAVMILPYTLVSFLAIWVLQFSPELAVLPLFGMTIMTAGVGVGVVLARTLKLDRPLAGSFVLSAGIANLGFTMGAFVNFALFGEQGLAVAQMYTLFWEFGMVLVLYPVARHYGDSRGAPLWKLFLANFRDVRSLPLVAAIIGLTLNRVGVPRPEFIGRCGVVNVLIIVGTVVAFFTTGLLLHFERIGQHRWHYLIIAGVKFLFCPAVAAVLVVAMWLIGVPLIRPPQAPAWKVMLVQASTPIGVYAVVVSNLFRLDDCFASLVFVVNMVMTLAIVLPLVVLALG